MVLEDLFRRPSALARFRMPPLGPLYRSFTPFEMRRR